MSCMACWPNAEFRGRQRGFSLVEVLISSVIALLIIGAAVSMATENTQSAGMGTAIADTDTNGRRLLDRMVEILRPAARTSLVPATSAGEGFLTFQMVTGVAPDGTQTFGPTQTLRLVNEPEDPADDIDNDGDGRIDECQIVWIRDVTDPSDQVVLGTGVAEYLDGETANSTDDNGNGLVDEPGLCFERVGSTITIRLTLLARVRALGLLPRSLETSFTLRN